MDQEFSPNKKRLVTIGMAFFIISAAFLMTFAKPPTKASQVDSAVKTTRQLEGLPVYATGGIVALLGVSFIVFGLF